MNIPPAKVKLFVALHQLAGPMSALGPHLEAHLAFMFDLEAKGILFASGPFMAGGVGNGTGMSIVRAASADHARELLSPDPFVTSGARTFEIREWHVVEGTGVIA